MSDQSAPTPDPVEYWLGQWSQLTAPVHSLMQSPVVQAYLRESSEALQQAVDYWGREEQGYKDLTGQLAARVGDLLSRQDMDRSDPTALQQQLFAVQEVVAEKLSELIDATEPLNQRQKRLLHFNLRQIRAALNPRNTFFSNPELVSLAADTGGQTLLNASSNYVQDLADSRFGLQIRRSSSEGLALGEDIAAAPGNLVFQNELIQLIRYQPATSSQFQIPLLIVPPCINRFYVFDLLPEESMVRWLLEQGQDVYIISWINPGVDLRHLGFDDYVRKGCLQAVEVAAEISGSEQVNLAGYCIGGLIAAIATASEQGRKRVASLSLFATLLDYSDPGELGIFTGPDILEAICAQIEEDGLLSKDLMSTAFTFLREEQLFWRYFRSRYLYGESLQPDALMYWGQDATDLPAKMAAEYLCSFYRDNLLCSDTGYSLGTEPVSLRNSDCPKYVLACERDHIVSSGSAINSAELLGGQVRIVQASGGHVRGVFNHPNRKKGSHQVIGEDAKTPGSWWTDWSKWLERLSGDQVQSKICAPAQYADIETAPGSYAQTKARN